MNGNTEMIGAIWTGGSFCWMATIFCSFQKRSAIPGFL